MEPERLPSPVDPLVAGHGHDHAALKVDYDKRHPNAPLPTLVTMGDHLKIHGLLAAEYNAENNANLNVEPQMVSFGHADAHNALHSAYNLR